MFFYGRDCILICVRLALTPLPNGRSKLAIGRLASVDLLQKTRTLVGRPRVHERAEAWARPALCLQSAGTPERATL